MGLPVRTWRPRLRDESHGKKDRVNSDHLTAGCDIETPDHAVLDPEVMADHFVGQQVTLEVVHGLVDIDDDRPIWAG